MKSIFKKLAALTLLICSLCFCACDTQPGPGGVTASTQAPDTAPALPSGDSAYGGMFTGIMEVNVSIAAADLARMVATADEEDYYQAAVTVNGQKCSTAGIKTRGNTSYVNEYGNNRYSFKIKFGKYQKGSKLNGLDEMYLNNMSYDPSYLREYLAYLAFSRLGSAAPLATFAKVTVNGEYYGLYLAVESPNDSFLKRAFGDNDGSLYKADKGSALTSDDTSTFELKNGDDTSMENVKKLAAALASGEDADGMIDVQSVLKYAAVISVLGCEDSYCGSKAENYYLYDNEGKMTVIPWDLKLSFGTDGSLRKSEYTIKASLVDASVTEPYFGNSADKRPLVSALLANEAYYAEYLGYVRQVRDFLKECRASLLSSLKASVDDAVAADVKRFYEASVYEAEFADGDISLLGYINKRIDNVTAQLGE